MVSQNLTHTKNCLYPYKKLFIPIQKTVYTHTKKLDIVWVFLYNKSIEIHSEKSFLYATYKHEKERIYMSSITENQEKKKQVKSMDELKKRKVVEHNDLITSIAKMDKTPLKILN